MNSKVTGQGAEEDEVKKPIDNFKQRLLSIGMKTKVVVKHAERE